jgi:hypothetical protein
MQKTLIGALSALLQLFSRLRLLLWLYITVSRVDIRMHARTYVRRTGEVTCNYTRGYCSLAENLFVRIFSIVTVRVDVDRRI